MRHIAVRMVTNIIVGYIVVLLAGGIVGFVKAGSKISLVTSLLFAGALALCLFADIPHGIRIAELLQVLLLGVFMARFVKTRKFMPSGLMAVVTALALALELAVSGTA